VTSARYNRHQMLTDEEARRMRSYRTLQAERILHQASNPEANDGPPSFKISLRAQGGCRNQPFFYNRYHHLIQERC